MKLLVLATEAQKRWMFAHHVNSRLTWNVSKISDYDNFAISLAEDSSIPRFLESFSPLVTRILAGTFTSSSTPSSSSLEVKESKTKPTIFSNEQRLAIDNSKHLPLTVISGIEGTGKTTTAIAIIEEWIAQLSLESLLYCSAHHDTARAVANELTRKGVKTILYIMHSTIIPLSPSFLLANYSFLASVQLKNKNPVQQLIQRVESSGRQVDNLQWLPTISDSQS